MLLCSIRTHLLIPLANITTTTQPQLHRIHNTIFTAHAHITHKHITAYTTTNTTAPSQHRVLAHQCTHTTLHQLSWKKFKFTADHSRNLIAYANIYCTMYTAQYTVYIGRYTVYIVYTVYTLHTNIR